MIDFLLKYPQIVYDQGELIFAREWPLWIAVTCFIIILLVISAMLLIKRTSLKLPQLLSIWVLQLLMVMLVLVVVWQPAIMTEKLRAGDNVIAIMLDTSESMNYTEQGASRMQTALAVLEEDAITDLNDQYLVQRFTFDQEATTAESYDTLPPPEQMTLLGDSVRQVLSMSRSTPLGAIVLVSDGADNAGTLTQDQLAEIAGFNVPVHTIGIGREAIAEDLELQAVSLPGQALPGTILAARVAVRHDKPGLARLKVYDNDNIIMSHDLELEEENTVTTAWIDIPVSDTGYRHLKFSLDPWEGEQVTLNNQQSRVVNVKEEKYRVLYIEGEPRWEYKFMRRAMDKDPSIELVSLLRVSQNKYYRQGITSADELEEGFPTNRAELFKYNALIIGSIEAASFTPDQQQMIHDFVSERGGSLLMIAGLNGLGNGGWENSQLNEVLPARLDQQDNHFVRDKVKVALTSVGLHSSMLKFDQDINENRTQWQELPEIADYQLIGNLKPAAAALLTFDVAGETHPLLVNQPYGRGFSYILATGGTWRWQMSLPLEDQRHETFWRQLLREMVIDTPGRFFMSSQVTGDRIRIKSEIRDEEYKPERELKLTAIVTPESGEVMTVELNPSTDIPDLMTGEFRADTSGLYNIETITRRDDEPVDSARMAIFHDAGKAEYFSLRTNRNLLQQLADATGGRYWDKDQMDELPSAVEFSSAGITEREI
ncbi:MAG: hypothetical protein HKN08_08520, partial [Gammaproteobacteria bacterium]|nr:hypothetical protein [Gammaproteobacteria bacterium]